MFYDTALSDRIEHAFQALALDEHRPPFSPAVWERLPANKDTTDLRQVWFPGNHGNVGGGWADQGIADISLAWLMDQLASVGVEFDSGSIDRIFAATTLYYRSTASQGTQPGDTLPTPISEPDVQLSKPIPPPSPSLAAPNWLSRLFRTVRLLNWAMNPIYENDHPIRPWALGAILRASSFIYILAGEITRTPGLYKKVNPSDGQPTAAFLEDTNERIHPSVRVRLAVKGLGLDDESVWDCPALLKNGWRLRRTDQQFVDPIPAGVEGWDQQRPEQQPESSDDSGLSSVEGPQNGAASPGGRWVWEYVGREGGAPPQRLLVEETLGPYERYLLKLAAGYPNVYEFAQERSLELVRSAG